MIFNGNKIDDETRNRIISEALKTQEGRTKLAMAMVNPIRRRLFHQSFLDNFSYKHVCSECGMGWNEDSYMHSDEECAIYLVHKS